MPPNHPLSQPTPFCVCLSTHTSVYLSFTSHSCHISSGLSFLHSHTLSLNPTLTLTHSFSLTYSLPPISFTHSHCHSLTYVHLFYFILLYFISLSVYTFVISRVYNYIMHYLMCVFVSVGLCVCSLIYSCNFIVFSYYITSYVCTCSVLHFDIYSCNFIVFSYCIIITS